MNLYFQTAKGDIMPGLQILYALCFFLRAHLSQAEDSLNVTQKPLIQVAFKNDQINIICENNFRSNSNVNSFVYQDGHWEKPLSTRHNIFNENEVQHKFKADSKSSVYYCMVAGNQKTNIGSGTYVHVRDSGYVEPSGASQYLRASLISLCILLLLSSIAGTLLLLLPLYWTKQAGLFRRAGLNFIGASTKSTAPQEGEEKTGSLYMSLQPHSEDVYDVLDSNAPDLKPEDKKPKVKIHDTIVQSPLKKPKAMIIPACFQETTKVNVEKNPFKLKPKVKIHDTIVQSPLKKPKAMIIPACFQETTKVPVNVEKTPIKLVKSDGMQEKTKEETEKKPVKLVKSAGIQEKTKGESEKPPIKLKPLREDTDHMVYENLHT